MSRATRFIITGVLIVFLIIVSVYVFYPVKNNIPFSPSTGDSVIVPKIIEKLYDIPVDSFNIEHGKIKRNQFIADIFRQYNLSEMNINLVTLKSKDVFDLRKLRAGNSFTAFIGKDSLYVLKYFVYEHSPVEYVFFEFSDSIKIEFKKKEVKLVEKTVSGKINSSLWNAIIENKINPLVAVELSDIYAWTVDFFGLQVGDSFRVAYSEMFVDTISVGVDEIHAAFFRHANHDFYAIPFVQNDVKSYFNEKGESLRKAFLKSPLKFSRISSKFSHSRMHPILKIRRPHHGVDYSAPVGTPVHAIGDGKVVKAAYEGGAGRMVKVKHNSTYSTAYLHLSRFGNNIRTGSYVKQGDIIGYVGSSGLSTGPHLDFRFYKNGIPVDPLKVQAPPAEPVIDENLAAFDSVKVVALKKLE